MTAHDDTGRLIAGKYRLVELVSGGGMGSVWRAHHLQLDAEVAVKFMHDRLLHDAGARVRFEREAKAAARIRSPHVVHVYDHGIDESGTPYMVMEFLEGEDLETRLKRVQRMPLEGAVRLCTALCQGLSRAHALGIVHRDLKPGNVFLCEPDDLVKIVDFGIAKETAGERVVAGETTAGQLLGSPHYMSPEQARGHALDARSDLWSLAAILFRAVTGKRPFRGHDFGDLAVRICTDPVPPPSSLDPGIGPSVDRFFARAFERDPELRYPSTEELGAAFEAAVLRPTASHDLELPRAPPKAPAREKQPPARVLVSRRRGTGIGAALSWLATVVLLGGALLGAWQYLRERGPVALPPPAPEDPRDAQVREAWESLYSQVRTNEIALAVESLERLVALDPAAPREKHNTILDLAVRALERDDRTSERMAALLTTRMGKDGVDLLFDVMITKPGRKAAGHAARLLSDPAVRARGSRDMSHAHAIHTAPRCADKRRLILRSQPEAGARTLRTIRALVSNCSGACCFKNDDAVRAIEAGIAARP